MKKDFTFHVDGKDYQTSRIIHKISYLQLFANYIILMDPSMNLRSELRQNAMRAMKITFQNF